MKIYPTKISTGFIITSLVFLILFIPFYTIILPPYILLGIYQLSSKISLVKKSVNYILNQRFLSILLFGLLILIIILWGLSWNIFLPDPLEVWYTLLTFDFTKCFNLLVTPLLNYEQGINSYKESLFEAGVIGSLFLGLFILFIFLCLIYYSFISKPLESFFINHLSKNGYYIFEMKWGLDLSNQQLNVEEIQCELCKNEGCKNIQYTNRLYTENEINKIRIKEDRLINEYLPGIRDWDSTSCKLKWKRILVSKKESGYFGYEKIKKGERIEF